MPFGHDIRLRRVICLRAGVDLYHFTFRVSEKVHVCRKANISYPASAGYFTQFFESSDPSFSSPLAKKDSSERMGLFLGNGVSCVDSNRAGANGSCCVRVSIIYD